MKIILCSGSPRRRELMAQMGLDFTVDTGTLFDEKSVPFDGLSPREYVQKLALGKNLHFHRALDSDEVLVTADTIVALGSKIYGKPSSRSEAIAMLEELAGREHEVLTAICVRWGDTSRHREMSPGFCSCETGVFGDSNAFRHSERSACFDVGERHSEAKPVGRSEESVLRHSEESAATEESRHLDCKVSVSRVRFAPMTPEEITHYVDAYNPLDKAGAYGIQEWIGLNFIESIEGSFYTIMGLDTCILYNLLKRE